MSSSVYPKKTWASTYYILNTKPYITANKFTSNLLRFRLLIDGYANELVNDHSTPDEILELIRIYAWNISDRSMACIAGTHCIASIISEYFNAECNKCEYAPDNDLNDEILKYIYVRGGALRDCYLLKEINDIDIVINIKQLSIKYLSHLKEYHSNPWQQSKDCKCIFWRLYTNKYDKQHDDDDCEIFQDEEFWKDSNDVDKILKFEQHIINCNYLLNSRFITKEILEKSEKLRKCMIVESRYNGYHWYIKLNNNCIYKNIALDGVEFDIVDQTVQYGKFQTLRDSKDIPNDYKLMLSEISSYKQNHKNQECISIPIYPFEFSVDYYDFTINSMHIDLYQILLNHNNNRNDIDYNWENKILYKQYNNHVINKSNLIGIQDINNKLLQCPSLNALNKHSANFYFWRLVKTAAKFIKSIEIEHKDTWHIDENYLMHTINLYDDWFGYQWPSERDEFLKKLYTWNIKHIQDFRNRLLVLRYIKFEGELKGKLQELAYTFHNSFIRYAHLVPDIDSYDIQRCLIQFGYPIAYNSRYSLYSYYRYYESDSDDVMPDENIIPTDNQKAMKKWRGKGKNNYVNNHRWKTDKFKKRQSYFKRKCDKKENKKTKILFKKRHMLPLQHSELSSELSLPHMRKHF